MRTKYASKSKKLETLRARSSVGRAPQWHSGASNKNGSSKSPIQFPKNAEVVEIPAGWEPVPAMRMENGKPVIYRVLLRTHPERLQTDYNGKRRSKSA